ncbi:MAG: methyltransferase regulatory domain-containing protein [Chloroflexi bacterium]|nr:methyltransferase regulatory domain-containing protein [Chloroflexota bacterium]
MLNAIRDMMLYHTRNISDPQAKVAEARVLLDFLGQSIQVNDSAHVDFLNTYLNFVKAYLQKKSDAYVLHDELSEVNEPIYFYQFAERLASHGLRYMADADFKTMLAGNLPGEVSQTLRQLAKDTITLEQYMDFLRGRTFRQSLLCHQEVQFKRGVGPERLANLYVASNAVPETPQPDTHSRVVEKFKAAGGAILSTDHPVTKMALLCLAEIWPKAMPFQTLIEIARTRLNGVLSSQTDPPDIAGDASVLAANLLKGFGYSEDLVELQVYEPHFVLEISERPIASLVARWQVGHDYRVTNLRHERIQLEGVSHHLLPYVDGSRDRAELQEILARLITEGVAEIRQDDQPITDPAQIRDIMAETLDAQLRNLARAALLVD